MKVRALLAACAVLLLISFSSARGKDKDDVPQSAVNFSVVKDDSGKPVRNAAVVLHPVDKKGRQQRTGFELKTDADGKTHFDGIPYGVLRIQVIAHGFQTYGDDFTIGQPSQEITIRLKRPSGQYSIYEDHDGNPGSTTMPPQK
jgi:5-hydroxyisourate hydrolase-like protein (transthyretin family)